MAHHHRWLLTAALLIALIGPMRAIGAKKKGGGNKDAPENKLSLAELNNRLVALEEIDAYRFTPSQLKQLQRLVVDIKAQVSQPAEPPAGEKLNQYRSTLVELLEAMESGKADEAKLDAMKQKVDTLAEAADYEYPSAPDPPEAARKAALDFARELRANQLASSLVLFGEHVTDPVELAVEAAESKKAAKADHQWPAVRDGAASEVAYLLAGWDADAAKPVQAKVSAWLDANADVDSPLPPSLRASWEQSAAKVLGAYDSWLVLRRWTERDVARILCNPQLPAALKAREPGE